MLKMQEFYNCLIQSSPNQEGWSGLIKLLLKAKLDQIRAVHKIQEWEIWHTRSVIG